MTNTSMNSSEIEDCFFNPYWIYALIVPFLGVIFNGLLLFVCASLGLRRNPRRQNRVSARWTHKKAHYTLSNRSLEDQSAPFCESSPQINAHVKPELALNSFVANCAISTLLASCLRTITTSYFFAQNYLLCPSVDDNRLASQIMQIFVYLEHSIFNVAYVNFLIVLNLDKLLFIMKPLHYRRMMTRRRIVCVCVFTWILSSAWLPMYFTQNEDDFVRWATILVPFLMVGPSVFCLVTSIILAVIVFRVRMQDRLRECSENIIAHPESYWWAYCKSVLRIFQSVLWTCVTSLPHPLAIIISYYNSVGDPSANPAVNFIIAYLSVAYFSGTPFMIMCTYPAYWRHLKLYFS